MALLQLYTLASVFINGSLLTEHSEVKVGRDTASQRVMTVAKGFAGVSPGAPMTTIDVTNAVPAGDFELNPGNFMKLLEVVEVTIVAAGRTLTSKGFITKDNFDHAVNKESSLSFSFEGEFADWT